MTKIITAALVACLLAGCATPPANPTGQTASTAPVHKKKPACVPQTGSHIADDSDCDSMNSGNPFLKHGEIANDRSGGGSLMYQGQTGH